MSKSIDSMAQDANAYAFASASSVHHILKALQDQQAYNPRLFILLL